MLGSQENLRGMFRISDAGRIASDIHMYCLENRLDAETARGFVEEVSRQALEDLGLEPRP